MKLQSQALPLVQTLLLIVSLWLVPTIVGGQGASQTALWHSLDFYRHAGAVASEGHLNPAVWSYHLWPAAWVFFATLIQVLGIDVPLTLVALVPFGLQLTYLLFLYVFFRDALAAQSPSVGAQAVVWAALSFFFLGNWQGHSSYISPQSFGFVLWLALAWFIQRHVPATSSDHPPRSFLTTYAIMAAAVATTHLLTGLYVISATSWLLFRRRWARMAWVLLPALLGAWLAFAAFAFTTENLPRLPHYGLFRLLELFRTNLVERATRGPEMHRLLTAAKVGYTVVFGLIGLLGVLGTLRVSNERRRAKPYFAMGIGLVGVSAFVGGSYGGELVDRLFLFLLPLIALFAVRLLRTRVGRIGLIVALAAAPPFHLWVHYGSQIVDYVSPSQFAGIDFFNRVGGRVGYITGNSHLWADPAFPEFGQDVFKSVEPQYSVLYRTVLSAPEGYVGIPFSQFQFEVGRIGYRRPDISPSPAFPHYVAITRLDHAVYEWDLENGELIRRIEHWLNMAHNVALVYSSGDFTLFIGN